MKTIIKTLSLTVACLLMACCTKEEFPLFHPGDSQKPTEGPDVPPTPPAAEPDWSRLTADAHPRVIFTDADFVAIKENAGANTLLKSLHDQIISKANRYLGAEDIKKVLSGKRMLDVSRKAEERLLACAYAYKTTGDGKYLKQAEHDLQTVCRFDNWNAKSHFLDVGEMAAGVGLAYDWLYKELSSETKTLVKKAINDFAFTPANAGQWNLNFYEAENNWNQVCNGGLVCAALAVYEDNTDIAKGIIEKAIESNKPAMEAMYSPDGNYPEGYSYWCYGTLYEALILTALETATGSDAGLSGTDGFSKTGKYMLYMEGPLNMCFNYSDCAPGSIPCFAQWYFAHKFNDLSLLYLEKDRLNGYGSAAEARLLTLIAYYASKLSITSLGDIPAPMEPIFRGEGVTPVVLIHDNWKHDITDKFLGIKGGKANTSHAHQDAGSFVYDAFGVRWSADLGLQSYGTLEPHINLWDMNDGSERWTAFRYNNFNHSTLTVNDAHHKVGGSATIQGIINVNGQKGAIVNMTAPLANEVESAVRTIYMEGDDLVIKDDIKAKGSKDAKVRWTMVSRATPTIENGGITLKSATGKYMYLKTSSTTGHRPAHETWSTKSNNVWDAENTGYYECGYEVTVKAGASAAITVRLTPNE